MITNPTRFYKPRRLARFTNKESLFVEENQGWSYFGGDTPLFGVVDTGGYLPMSRRIVGENDEDLAGLGDYQITYNFSSGIRNNKFARLDSLFKGKNPVAEEYGAPGWSFRMLYEFLCEIFNGGVPFIDTYFERVFKTRMVYYEFQNIWDDIIDDANNELYNAPQRNEKGRFVKLPELSVWRDKAKIIRCQALAEKIRQDIQDCLATRKLPLRGHPGATVSVSTRKTRKKLLGMKSYKSLFYASGQLINDLNIYIEVGGKAA